MMIQFFWGNIGNSWSAYLGKLLNKPNTRLNPEKKNLKRFLKHHSSLSEPSSNASKRIAKKKL